MMKNSASFILLVSSVCFAQTNVERHFNKILLDIEKRIESKYSEYGIKNQLWSQNFNVAKKGDVITFYTTSNNSLCHLKVLSFFKNKRISINEADNCNEPPTISITKIFYNYKIYKNHLKIFDQDNSVLDLKIINIENYQQEKFGENSFKLTFSVE